MPILIVLTLVPTLSFYFYVLVQFWAEANRRRHHDTCTMIVPLHSVRAAQAEYDLQNEYESQPGAQDTALATHALEPGAEERLSKQPPHPKVLSTYLQNRFLAIRSQTARLQVRRAAKG
jgi:hypothetical protein